MTCEVDSEYMSLRLFDETLFVQFQVIKHLFEQSVRISSTFSTFIILKHELFRHTLVISSNQVSSVVNFKFKTFFYIILQGMQR